MTIEKDELDQIQSNYKAAVEEWVTAIRLEEDLASSNQSVVAIDQWEGAANREEDLRRTRPMASCYRDALQADSHATDEPHNQHNHNNCSYHTQT